MNNGGGKDTFAVQFHGNTLIKQMFSDLKIPLILIVMLSVYATLTVPILPIDETRYVSVAWEMWNNHSFLVPCLNGEPYSQKPPMLFWMIQAGWKLFSVNDFTPRMIPGIFSLLNLLLVYRIGIRLWPDDRKAAVNTALILVSTMIWAVWSFAIMFDMILAFWILLGLLGTLRASAKQRDGWLMLIAGIAGGLLTKGPAALVYLLSVPLFRVWWDIRRNSPVRATWYAAVLGSAAIGFAFALLWAVPAAIQGGETYGNDILWSQTAGRIALSSAHSRPFWWYLPILPLFFFPWILFRASFARLHLKTADEGVRFCATWLGLPLLIFSLVSGKQIHYLIPFIPAGALLMGRNLARVQEADAKISTRVFGGILLLLSLAALWFPSISKSGGDLGPLDAGDTRFIAAGLFACGFLFLLPFRKNRQSVRKVALIIMLLIFSALFQNRQAFLDNYDIKGASVLIKSKMDAGYSVAHVGKYHGQYQFLGRLKTPLTVIENTPEEIDGFAQTHPQALFISYEPEGKDLLPKGAQVCFSHEFRGKNILLWQLAPKQP